MSKAPDKIYCGNNGHGNLSYSTEKIYPLMEDYIRKDALLEWAKDKHIELDPPKNERDFGRIEAVEELIYKINSL